MVYTSFYQDLKFVAAAFENKVQIARVSDPDPYPDPDPH
jgi:hypothetical protein